MCASYIAWYAQGTRKHMVSQVMHKMCTKIECHFPVYVTLHVCSTVQYTKHMQNLCTCLQVMLCVTGSIFTLDQQVYWGITSL